MAITHVIRVKAVKECMVKVPHIYSLFSLNALLDISHVAFSLVMCVYVCVQQAAHSIHLNVHWFVMLIIDVTLSNVHLNVQLRLCMSGESLGTWLLYSHV